MLQDYSHGNITAWPQITRWWVPRGFPIWTKHRLHFLKIVAYRFKHFILSLKHEVVGLCKPPTIKWRLVRLFPVITSGSYAAIPSWVLLCTDTIWKLPMRLSETSTWTMQIAGYYTMGNVKKITLWSGKYWIVWLWLTPQYEDITMLGCSRVKTW